MKKNLLQAETAAFLVSRVQNLQPASKAAGDV